jgi:hypothetical protein
MKFCITLLAATASFCYVNAQAPKSMNYQAIARNNAGAVVANQSVGLRFSIRDGSAGGTILYRETDTATTNQFGLFTTSIGAGVPVTGTFSAINWISGPKFLQVEIDISGGTSYIDMGTSQLLSVPYALAAESLSGNANVAPSQITSGGATNNQVLKWNGGNWVPSADNNTTYTAGNGLTLTGNTFAVNTSDFNVAPVIQYTHTSFDVSSTLNGVTLLTLTIDAPASGSVVLNAGYDLSCLTCANASATSSYSVFITNNPTALFTSLSNRNGGRIAGPENGNQANSPVTRGSVQQILPVTAGPNTFYLRAVLSTTSETVRISRPSLTAIYVRH